MSILIKGMKMPKSCEKCPFFDYEEGFCFASGVKGKNGWYEFTLCPGGIKGGRADDCPLVPVPPHGRLIDADDVYHVLTAYYHHSTDFQREALKEALARVSTIIGAEDGEI